MKNLKPLMSVAVLASAMASQAQFGAASKSSLLPTGDKSKQDILVNAFFTSQSGGGSTDTGLLFNFEKALKYGANLTSIGGFIQRVDSQSILHLNFKSYLGKNFGTTYGGWFNSDTSPDFSGFVFYDLPSIGVGERQLSVQLGAGGVFATGESRTNFATYIRASYPLQNGLTVDLSLLNVRQTGSVRNTFALGLGYRF